MGNALVDILIRIDTDDFLRKHHLSKGSMQLVDADFAFELAEATSQFDKTFVAGGSAANTISGLARLGVATAFVGKVSEDEYGSAFSSDMRTHNVNPRLIVEKGANKMSGFCTTLISPDGERTFATHLGVASELEAKDIEEAIFKGYTLLHIEGYLVQNHDLIHNAIKSAKKQGLEVSLDLASYNVVDQNRDFLQHLIEEYVDIVFANEEEATTLTHLSVEDSVCYLAKRAKVAIVKIGAQGSWVMSGEQKERIAAFPAKRIDTTGAGDLYASGFLYGYIQNDTLHRCGQIGSYLASKIVEIVGTKFTENTWKMLLEAIKHL